MSVRVQDAGGVRTIAFDRPEKRNALTAEMLEATRAAIAEAEAARVVLLLGEGRVFSAGFDLRSADETTAERVLHAQITSLAGVLQAIDACPVPVAVGVQRAGIAGASAILSAADLVVADRAATLGYPVTRLGISPAVSGASLAGAALGAARALMLEPAPFTAERGLELGLVHELVDEPEEVGPRATELARQIADKPAGGVAATKAWVRELSGETDFAAARDASLASIDADTIERLRAEVWNR